MNNPPAFDFNHAPTKIFPGSSIYLPPNSVKRLRQSSTDSSAAKKVVTKKKASSFIFSRRNKMKSTSDEMKSDSEHSTPSTSSSKGVVPIFVQKTYRMVEEGDPSLIEWSSDGEMFVVKDKKKLAKYVIPNYFEHSKFASFDRQLNFYGFRKIQNKPVWNKDYDPKTAEYAIYHNENFKRGRTDLLLKIERSTKNKTTTNKSDEEVNTLKEKVSSLSDEVDSLKQELVHNNGIWEYRFAVLQRQMTLMMANPNMMALQQQAGQQANTPLERDNSLDIERLRKEFANSQQSKSTPVLPSEQGRDHSLASLSMSMGLSPHPKTKPDISTDSIPPPPIQKVTRDLSNESAGIDMDAFLKDFSESIDSNTRRMSVLSIEALSSPELLKL